MSEYRREIAAAVAVALIGASVLAAFSLSYFQSPQVTIPGGQTSTSGLTGGQTSNQGTTSNTGTSQLGGPMAVLLTSSPTAPANTTSASICYTGFSFRSVAGVWTTFKASGTVDLITLVNKTQTVFTTTLEQGSYDQVQIDLCPTASVKFGTMMYPASLQSLSIVAPISGGVRVASSAQAAAIIDLQSLVLSFGGKTGTQTSISFMAQGYALGGGFATAQVVTQGTIYNVSGNSTWKGVFDLFVKQVRITGGSLSPTSLSLDVTNAGNESANVAFISVSPSFSGSCGTFNFTGKIQPGMPYAPTCLGETAVFRVSSGGQLTQVNGSMQYATSATGYILSSGASTTFSYSGQVYLNSTNYSSTATVTAGKQYLVSVFGFGFAAWYLITAS